MTIYERVRETAKEQGMSLKQLESKAKLGDGAIYKWKKYTPRGSNLQKVADVLGVSVDYLLGNTSMKRASDWDSIFQYNMETFRDDISTVQNAINDGSLFPEVDILETDRDDLIILSEKAEPDTVMHYAKVIQQDAENKSDEVSDVITDFADVLIRMSEQRKKDAKLNNPWRDLPDISSLPDNERKRVLDSAKAYVEGMIEVYSNKNDSSE